MFSRERESKDRSRERSLNQEIVVSTTISGCVLESVLHRLAVNGVKSGEGFDRGSHSFSDPPFSVEGEVTTSH